MNVNAAETLRRRAASMPEATALVFPEGAGWASLTFAELDRGADQYAHGFAAKGIRRGDRMLCLFRPSLEFYQALYGMLRLGAVPVFVDTGMGLRNVFGCVERIRPDAVVALPIVHALRQVVRRPFASARLHVTAGRRWFWGGPTLAACKADATEPYPVGEYAPDDEALIAFTSGSTGPAKGVSFTHGMVTQQIAMITERYGWGPGTTSMMGFAAFVLLSVGGGCKTVVPDMDLTKPATADPENILRALREHRVNHAFASPIVWMKLVRHLGTTGGDLRGFGLGHVVTTGAPIQADLHRRMRALTDPGFELVTTYGATEALPVSTVSSSDVLGETWERTAKGAGTCVGSPFDGVRIRIVPIHDDPIPTWDDGLELGADEIGEVVIDAPIVSPEYKEAPDANAAAKIRRDGQVLHRMGDLGYLDDRGRLWFCGRKGHRLLTATGMVPAVPVENVFNEHPKVFRTALVGLGEPGSQEPVLIVEMEAGVAFGPELPRELVALAVGTRWDGVVRRFLPHPSFPVDPRHNSKIDRGKLAAWAATAIGDARTA